MIKGWWEKIRLIIMLSPPKLMLLVLITVSSISLLFQLGTFLLSPTQAPSHSCNQSKAALLQEIGVQGQ